jgi:hypothetical protein
LEAAFQQLFSLIWVQLLDHSRGFIVALIDMDASEWTFDGFRELALSTLFVFGSVCPLDLER